MRIMFMEIEWVLVISNDFDIGLYWFRFWIRVFFIQNNFQIILSLEHFRILIYFTVIFLFKLQ